jgi:ADP-ribose pyrophosphatase
MTTMSAMFFYGTLCDLELLEIVLDRSRDIIEMYPARLMDHGAYWAKTQNYPVIIPEIGRVTQGLYVPNLSDIDIKRLDFYESGFVYEPETVRVHTDLGEHEVLVYYCHDQSVVSDRPWNLADWQTSWGITIRRAIRELMDQFGKIDPQDFDRWYPFCEDRAHAWAIAQADDRERAENGAGDCAVEILAHDSAYTKFYALKDVTLRHRRFDGSMSEPLDRALFVSRDAAMVLPYDPVGDRILLVEQFRMGPWGRGDRLPWMYEPIAGMIDLGETPIEAAEREAKEEAGLKDVVLKPMFEGYPSPGASTSYFHFFLGLCDLSGYDDGIGGLQNEGEDIRTHIMSFDAAMELVMTGQCRVLPLTTALLWLAQYRNHDLVS